MHARIASCRSTHLQQIGAGLAHVLQRRALPRHIRLQAHQRSRQRLLLPLNNLQLGPERGVGG